MNDNELTRKNFDTLINILKGHDSIMLSCGDPLIDILEDVRKLIDDQQEQIAMMKFAYGDQGEIVGELVRCNECKHGSLYCTEDVCGATLIECNHPDFDETVSIHKYDWFCADGEKR